MTITKTLLLTAMLGVAAPVLANSHMEAKKDGHAPTTHDGMAMDHKHMDTSKMSKEELAAHKKMIDAAAMKDKAAADKMATPK